MMRGILLILLLSLVAIPAFAEIVVPTRTIRAKEIITATDLVMKPIERPGALRDASNLIGLEARVSLYPGRAIRPEDVGPAAIVERNEIVPLIYRQGTLRITTEGRALGRGAVGETIRIMNLASRSTVWGEIGQNGNVEVSE